MAGAHADAVTAEDLGDVVRVDALERERAQAAAPVQVGGAVQREALDRLEALDGVAGDVAAVLMEPALTNIGIVLPEPGYLAGVREITHRAGTLLILDETHTFSAGPGGVTGAEGLSPDVLTIGKAIAGGIPCGAYGLSAALADGWLAARGQHERDRAAAEAHVARRRSRRVRRQELREAKRLLRAVKAQRPVRLDDSEGGAAA